MPLATRSGLALLAVLMLTAAAPCQGFVDVTASAGLSLTPNLSLWLGRGACFGDFDSDGDQDLVYPQGQGGPIHYYENQGNGTFADRTAVANLGTSPDRPHACVAADVDNDGDLDLFMPGHFQPNRMYINDGTGTFSDEGLARGLANVLSGSLTASFGDYDRDGLIDLYVGNYVSAVGGGEANQLYRNIGAGFFQDVTLAAGVGNTGLCFTGIFHDYNDDGWPDIFVGNDKGWYPGQQPDTTYRNNGDGTFTNVGLAINTQFGIGAMGSDFTDAFNDGGWDIFVSNTSAGHLFHVWNPGTLIYDELATTHGVVANVEGWATNFLDYDNDGWQDLYIVHSYSANAMFRNSGAAGGPWTDESPNLGLELSGSTKYTSAVVDYDNDGRMDILCPRPNAPGVLFRNTTPAGNWVRLRLEGTLSNRSAIGAKVSVTVGATTTTQAVRTGHGYLGGHDLRLHFGAGAANTVDRVFIQWPTGQTQTLLGLATNVEHHILEPRLTAPNAAFPGASITLDILSPNEPNRAFLLALSAGNQGFPLPDGRWVPVDFDWLLTTSTTPGNGLLVSPNGTLDGVGVGSATVNIPPIAALSGSTFFAAAALTDPAAPIGVATILGATSIVVQ